jgi:Family of unknown function (DUF6338)
MPATLEAVFVLLVFLAPGFIAVRVKNSLLPYRIPSAFQETVEAAVASTVLLPVWWIFAWRLLHARAHIIDAATKHTAVDVLGVGAPLVGVVALVYFVCSPALGILYALVQTYRPYARLAWAFMPSALPGDTLPDVWDRLFSEEDERPWVVIWFKNAAGAIGGLVQYAGLSPSGRQLFLVPLEDVPQSLVRFDKDGAIVEDLTPDTDGIWVDVNAEVLWIEVFD